MTVKSICIYIASRFHGPQCTGRFFVHVPAIIIHSHNLFFFRPFEFHTKNTRHLMKSIEQPNKFRAIRLPKIVKLNDTRTYAL